MSPDHARQTTDRAAEAVADLWDAAATYRAGRLTIERLAWRLMSAAAILDRHGPADAQQAVHAAFRAVEALHETTLAERRSSSAADAAAVELVLADLAVALAPR